LEVPRFTARSLETARGLLHLTGLVEAVLYGDLPMLHFPAEPGVNPNRPPLRRGDIPAMRLVLRNLGFQTRYVKQEIFGRLAGYATVEQDQGWHVDNRGEGSGLSYYPHVKAIDLRRHTAAGSASLVQARTTQRAPYGTSGFKRDPAAPVYETVQQPGDSLYFVALGGLIGDVCIPQAEHNFISVTTEPRRIHVSEFECTPRRL